MWAYPGKKLLFMGQEFAQGREWSEERGLDWEQTGIPAHAGVQTLVRDLNHAYRGHPALHARDCEPEGFEWLVVDDTANSVLAWLRKAPDANPVAVVANFTPATHPHYRLPLPSAGRWREIVNTDAATYGGTGEGNAGEAMAEDGPDGAAAVIALPPLATLWLEFEPGA
jgi:1,4-alpha-glucan branching enzyme